jgi:DNA-directed RNA polymerase subunit RPC12/RpoP
MLSLSTPHHETCPRCGSGLVSLEWDERVNAREIQDLWRCWKCQNEFITVALSDKSRLLSLRSQSHSSRVC